MKYKHDYDKTLTRLNTILARLNDGESLSVKDLAEEFNVSDRTIQRDFNERLITLYPIYQEKKKWKMQEGFKIEKSTNIEDIIVLDILEKMTENLGDRFSVRAKTLLSKIRNQDYNPIYAKLNMEDISEHISTIAELEDAIKDNREISCKYEMDGRRRHLNLKPLKIANYEGFWYLIAIDARDEILKKYYIKSIFNIILNDKYFTTSKGIEELLENSISIWFSATNDAFEVELHLAPDAAKIMKRKPISKSQRLLKEFEDGSMEIVVKVTNKMEILPIIKYWIPHIRVIGPEWLAEVVDKDVELYLEKLRSNF